MGPLTRRSSERELNECSGKKRAASAGGLSNRSTDGKFVSICFVILPAHHVDDQCFFLVYENDDKINWKTKLFERQIFQNTIIRDIP